MFKNLLYLALSVTLFAFIAGNAQAQYVSVDCATASAGTPVGPTNNTLPGGGGFTEAASVIPTTGQTNYAFIVTNPAPNPTILGITYDGVYDLTGKPGGAYGFTGITYNNAELETVAGLVCALPLSFLVSTFGVTQATAEQIKTFICGSITSTTPVPPVTLDKLFGLLSLLSGTESTIDSVAVQLETIAGNALVTVCYATTASPAYTVLIDGVSVNSINGFDNIAVSPTLATNRVVVSGNVTKSQDLTIELTDLTGRRLASYQEPATIGNFAYEVPLSSNIPSGYLLLNIRSNEGVYTAKVWHQ